MGLALKELKYCSPDCSFFRCGKKSLKTGRGDAWCTYTNDYCVGYKCNYASCIRNKLLNDGVCGLTIKRRAEDLEPPEELDIQVKIRSKLMKKLGEKEIF
ncbi:hypothetical protein KEJ25_09080 [Candidatus Bathyarchaeota archaeon]|nr:hypothetical protein [Candidatus Bathyarchaeota archaeon]